MYSFFWKITIKKFYIIGLLTGLLFCHTSFAKCTDGSWGEFVPPKTQNFKKLQGIWMSEQEKSGVFEIRPENKGWVLVTYHFNDGYYSKTPMKAMKNGTFLQRDDGYYRGYDVAVKEIVSVDDNGCRITGSGRLNSDDVKSIYSPEGYTNVRSGAGKNHAVIRKIPNGTKIVIADYDHNRTTSNWKEVMYFHYDKNLVGEGFVHKSQFK